MRILLGKHTGFCFGVRRAANLAVELAQTGRKPLYTLGPLMHNPQEVARLASMGIQPRSQIEDCKGGITIIRTHGITRQEEDRAKCLGIELVDATCPHVRSPRRNIIQFGREGRTVFLVGDRGHPEVSALVSHAQGPIFVVSATAEIPDLVAFTPIGMVAQTTQSKDTYIRTVQEVQRRFPDVKTALTVCRDSEARQKEACALAREVEVMLVVGGRNSANTRRLGELSQALCPKTFHVELKDELPNTGLCGVSSVGVVSGASTPDWLTAEIVEWLKEHCHGREEEIPVGHIKRALNRAPDAKGGNLGIVQIKMIDKQGENL